LHLKSVASFDATLLVDLFTSKMVNRSILDAKLKERKTLYTAFLHIIVMANKRISRSVKKNSAFGNINFGLKRINLLPKRKIQNQIKITKSPQRTGSPWSDAKFMFASFLLMVLLVLVMAVVSLLPA